MVYDIILYLCLSVERVIDSFTELDDVICFKEYTALRILKCGVCRVG